MLPDATLTPPPLRLAAGHRVLVLRAGEESAALAVQAADRGLDVVCIDAGPGDGDALAALTHLLWWDPSVRAVLVASGEMSTSAVRAAMDLTGSAALLVTQGFDHMSLTDT